MKNNLDHTEAKVSLLLLLAVYALYPISTHRINRMNQATRRAAKSMGAQL